MKIFLGIDIGKNGGICALNEQNKIVLLEKFPKKNVFSTMMSWKLDTVFYGGETEELYCIKEEPLRTLGPKIGGTYSRGISIGHNIGFWEFWLQFQHVRWIDKHPRSWQKAFPEFQMIGGKERSEAAAIREIPECKDRIYGPRGALRDGLSDSVLLAVACKILVERRMFL